MKLFKNVDILDLQKIMKEGILPISVTGNVWTGGRRAPNSKDVVYLFDPLTERNTFMQYGIVLLEVDIDNAEPKELMENDVNQGLYKEYTANKVAPEDITAIYIPETFRHKIAEHVTGLDVTYVDISVDYWDRDSEQLQPATAENLEWLLNKATMSTTEYGYLMAERPVPVVKIPGLVLEEWEKSGLEIVSFENWIFDLKKGA